MAPWTRPPTTAVLALILVAPVLAGCITPNPNKSFITITVDDVPRGGDVFAFNGTLEYEERNITALTQLERFGEQHGFEVQTTFFADFNSTLVDGVNGLLNQPGPSGGFYFWEFRPSDIPAQVGADKYVLKKFEHVYWRYTLSFFGPVMQFTVATPGVDNNTVVDAEEILVSIAPEFDVPFNAVNADTGKSLNATDALEVGKNVSIKVPLLYGANNLSFSSTHAEYGDFFHNLTIHNLLSQELHIDANATSQAVEREVDPFGLGTKRPALVPGNYSNDPLVYTIADQLRWYNQTFGVSVVIGPDGTVRSINGQGEQRDDTGQLGFDWRTCVNGVDLEIGENRNSADLEEIAVEPGQIIRHVLVSVPDGTAADDSSWCA